MIQLVWLFSALGLDMEYELFQTTQRWSEYPLAPGRVEVEVRPFNDRQLNRDLQALCERVAAAQPTLPDGRRLCFTVAGTRALSSHGQRCTGA
jgi:hypothetical protein